jgi:hypothetical protein
LVSSEPGQPDKAKRNKKERKRGEKAKDAMHVYNNNSIKKKKQKIVYINLIFDFQIFHS